jgi:hypothetical protein
MSLPIGSVCLRGSINGSAPDVVEGPLILWEYPALCDTAALEAVQAMRSPRSAFPVPDRGSGRDDESVLVVRQDILDGDFESVVGERTTSPHVLHDLIPAPVIACDRALAGYVPHDVIGEDVRKRPIVTMSARSVLLTQQAFVRMLHPNDRLQPPHPADL